jgi:uncharacterized protein YutE (UPF0331/DUF86 family)
MTFQDYLAKTALIAETEKEILDRLSSKENLSDIEIRAAKNSLQVLIENSIGKAKKILKHYYCPMTPKSGRDAFTFMYEIGLIEDEVYTSLLSAVGFRNALIHDYMNFDDNILLMLLEKRKYEPLYAFLIASVDYNDALIKRIEKFEL